MTVRPVAQPPCRPPKGTKGGTFHWLRRHDGSMEVAQWSAGRWARSPGLWRLCGSAVPLSISQAVVAGWRYVGPCTPPEVKDG